MARRAAECWIPRQIAQRVEDRRVVTARGLGMRGQRQQASQQRVQVYGPELWWNPGSALPGPRGVAGCGCGCGCGEEIGPLFRIQKRSNPLESAFTTPPPLVRESSIRVQAAGGVRLVYVRSRMPLAVPLGHLGAFRGRIGTVYEASAVFLSSLQRPCRSAEVVHGFLDSGPGARRTGRVLVPIGRRCNGHAAEQSSGHD